MFHGSVFVHTSGGAVRTGSPSKHAVDIVQVRGGRPRNGGRNRDDSVTVRMPMTFRKRGGWKQVIAPDGHLSWAPPRARIDNTMIKALARAFRWRRMLETGRYATIDELARAEKINASYVSRVLRLTLLAPEIVEAILDGRQAAKMTLPVLMGPFSLEWGAQFDSLEMPPA